MLKLSDGDTNKCAHDSLRPVREPCSTVEHGPQWYTNPMTQTPLEARLTDLERLRCETPAVQSEATLTQMRAEDARRDYQAGKLALPALMVFELERSGALRLLDAHTAALADLEQQREQQLKAEKIAALKTALERNIVARFEVLTAALQREENAELEVHAARQEARRVRVDQESRLIDEGRQQVAQLAALEGRPSPAIALLVSLEEKQEYAARLDQWMLDDSSRTPRVDHLPLVTVSSPAEVLFDHQRRWEQVLVSLTSLKRR